MSNWDVNDWFAGFGVVLGLLSLGVAGAALAYSRRAVLAAERSARAAEASAEHEAQRRHEDAFARWGSSLEEVSRGIGQLHRLRLELLTAEVVDRVELRSLDPALLSFRDNQDGVSATGGRAQTVRAVRPGRQDDAAWMVLVPQPSPGGTCRLEVTSVAGEHSGQPLGRWTQTIDVALPPRPARMSQARFTR